MFCTSLRRRPSFAPAIPSLQDATGLNLKESQLSTHDLFLRLSPPNQQNPFTEATTPKLQILLLSPSCTKDLTTTIERIQHFALLSGQVQHLAIIFLLSPPRDTTFSSAKNQLNPSESIDPVSNALGVEAYSTLRVHLIEHCPPALSIPFLFLTTLDRLTHLLKKHLVSVTSSQARTSAAASSIPTSLNLLSLCSAGNKPLSRDTTYMVSDLFPNLKALARTFTALEEQSSREVQADQVRSGDTSTPIEGVVVADEGGLEKLRDLRDLVGEGTFRDMLDFWREEFIMD